MHRTVELRLGLLAVIITLGLLLYAASVEEERMAREATAQQACAVEVGAGLYDQHCRTCHGADGQGVGQLGPALNERHFFTQRLQEVGWAGTLEEYVSATIALGRVVATRPLYAGDGVVVMPAWSQAFGGALRPDQIRALTAFVLNWRATALGEVTLLTLEIPRVRLDDPQIIAQGQEVFVTAGCGRCHTVAGLSDGAIGPDLSRVGALAATRKADTNADQYLRESILIPNAYFVQGFEEIARENMCGGILSEEQLDMLTAFLLSLH
ncbi:MAG: hypothetical protein DDG58_05070 [Ardenticatenia bacterium]|nr:MAG: hypothetical protein DDG58_05070 [Ardenticatenia bacterium]